MTNAVSLELVLQEADADEDDLHSAAQALQRELVELGVERAELVRSDVPVPGTKGDAITVGALAVAVLPDLIPKFLEFVSHWLKRAPEPRAIRVRLRDRDRVVDIELDNSQASLKTALSLAKRTLADISAAPS